MSDLNVGGFSVSDTGEGNVNLPMAMVGAVGGALVMGAVYGGVGKFVGEFAYLAVLIGVASGMGVIKLGGGRSIVAGIVGGVVSLVAVLGAKLIVGSPEGVSFIEYHMTMFDIIFCYVLNPVAAIGIASTDKARALMDRLPF